MPKVTVFIPVFNTEKYIGQAIDSIIAQTYTDWELVVQDDCSTDNTFPIISDYAAKDSRIKIFRNEKNLGMMGNWIAGIPKCGGEYWGKLDADDTWAPTMIEECVAILDKNESVGLVCSRYEDMDEPGNRKQKEALPGFASDKKFSCIDLAKLGPAGMFQYNVLRQGIGLMRRKIFNELGTFTTLDSGDTEMWFRIGCHYDIYCIDKVLHHHRIWPESFMRKSADKDALRANRNFFETRNAIFDHYYQYKKISAAEYRKFKNDTEFLFNSFLIYRNRANSNYGGMLKHLFRNFSIDTKRTLKENLHIDRLFGAKKA